MRTITARARLAALRARLERGERGEAIAERFAAFFGPEERRKGEPGVGRDMMREFGWMAREVDLAAAGARRADLFRFFVAYSRHDGPRAADLVEAALGRPVAPPEGAEPGLPFERELAFASVAPAAELGWLRSAPPSVAHPLIARSDPAGRRDRAARYRVASVWPATIEDAEGRAAWLANTRGLQGAIDWLFERTPAEAVEETVRRWATTDALSCAEWLWGLAERDAPRLSHVASALGPRAVGPLLGADHRLVREATLRLLGRWRDGEGRGPAAADERGPRAR